MYSNISSFPTVKSGLLTGIMWDTMLTWFSTDGIHRNGQYGNSNSWGNYSQLNNIPDDVICVSYDQGDTWVEPNERGKDCTHSFLLQTGHSIQYLRKNIYDVAGNLGEYTSERYYKSEDGHVYDMRIYRGGHYGVSGYDYPASYRAKFYGTADQRVGFRVALYIQ